MQAFSNTKDIWAAFAAGRISEADVERLMLHHATPALASKNKDGVLVEPPVSPPRVRRGSVRVGDEMLAGIWRSVTRKMVKAIVLAAKKYELAQRVLGRRRGPLGHVGIEVLEYFASVVCYRSGRLDPAIDTICARIRRSRDAVINALKSLREHGFLTWERRYEPTGATGAAPRVRQASNAYRIDLPAVAALLLPAKSPEADDLSTARAERQQALDMMSASEMPLAQRIPSIFGRAPIDDPICSALARLGIGMGLA